MNNTTPIIGKENQYEYRCGICRAAAYGPKGAHLCADCHLLNERMKQVFATADDAAKGWETNRKGTTENGVRYIREDIAFAAMRGAYKLGWDDQCDVVAGCLV